MVARAILRRARTGLCLVALCGPATAAHAQRVAVVPVPVAGATEPAAAQVRAAAAVIGRDVTVVGDGVALARAALHAGAVPASRLAAMGRVIDGAAEGWRAYLQVAVPFAASRLSKARGDAEALLPLAGGLELYADLSLRLGAAMLSLGRADEAEETLALAVALDPQREVSLVEFSPDIVEAVERARRRQVSSVGVTISSPGVDGVSIELDGRAIGRTGSSPPRPSAPTSSSAGPAPRSPVIEPVVLGPRRAPAARASARIPALRVTLPRGQHVVVARRRGYQATAQAVRIEPPTTEIELRLIEDRVWEALEAAAAPGMDDERTTSLVEGVLTYGDVDEVLLTAVSSRRGAPALLAQRCGASLRCTAVVEVGYVASGLTAAMRQAWGALARGELRYPPSLPSDSRILPQRVVGTDGKCRLCRSPWLWAGVGSALVVTSAVLIFVLGQEDPAPVLTVDPDVFVGR